MRTSTLAGHGWVAESVGPVRGMSTGVFLLCSNKEREREREREMFPETPSETVNLHSEREKLKTLFGGPQVTWWRLFGGVQRKSMRNPSGAAE